MSEAPQDPALLEILNEYRRLQRQLESKTAQLDSLVAVNAEAGAFPLDFDAALYRRYSVDITFQAGENNIPTHTPFTQSGMKEGSVTVKKGTFFRCKYIESFVKAVGTTPDPYSGDDVTVQATLSWPARLSLFDFLWNVRDTGTDREWCDRPQPSLFLGGGYMGPLWLPRRTILGGGTVITVAVDPFRNSVTNFTSDTFFASGSVEEYSVQISFVGHDVPDGSVL